MDTAIRTTTSPRQAHEWALVLSATGIPHRVHPGAAGWTVLVFAADAARAQGALDAYDDESRPDPDGAAPDAGSRLTAWTVGVVTGALLLGFFAFAGPPSTGSCWFARGAAVAGLMRSSEPWRALTALTLHVDAVHAAGNAVAVTLLLAAAVPQLGPGGALFATLLAGAAGNLLAALLRAPAHVAVGASTATFGTIGLLAGLRLFSPPSPPRGGSRPWLVLTASVVLVAMLGTGPRSDQIAHALGLLSGLLFALPANRLLRAPRTGAIVQAGLVAVSALALLGAWLLALRTACSY